MDRSTWDRVTTVFQEAFEATPEQRRRLLDGLPPVVRAEVQSLLDAHSQSDVLEPHTAADHGVGAHYGPYRTTELIGQGGMGAVFRAVREDGEFAHEVAIKIIGGRAFDRLAEERFRAERQILARLQHPNIVRLLDGGIAGGQRYFVMELLHGERITEYCRRRSLGVPETLRLFLQVTAAIQYAHQSLIIHRDLKPSNILVTGNGEAKVLDFGIAKFLDPEGGLPESATQSRSLTLDCASPELVQGAGVTTATDVYSLGLLLYQLLTGVNPQPTGECSLEEALRIIREHEPKPPSTLAPDVHRDIDAIVAKAIAKQPERRYSSVEQLSDDVTRYLDGRPILARPVTAAYVAARFITRHRWGVSAVAGFFLLIGCAVGGILWQASKTERQRQLAERRFDQSRKLLRSMIFDLQQKLRKIPATVEVRKSLVEQGLGYLEDLGKDAVDRPDLLREIAASYENLGELQGDPNESSLGDIDGASKTYRRALAITDQLLSTQPADATTLKLASRLHRRLALSVSRAIPMDEKRAHLEQSAALTKRLLALKPRDRDSREFLATSFFFTASSHSGQPDELELWHKTLALYQELHQEAPNEVEFSRDVALVHKNLVDYWDRRKEGTKSLEHARLALEIDERLLQQNPDDPRTRLDAAIDHNQIATALHRRSMDQQALSHFRTSVEIRAALAANNPRDARFQERYAFSLRNLGASLLSNGRPREAVPYLTKAVELWTPLLAAGTNLRLEWDLGWAYMEMGKCEIALHGNGCGKLKKASELMNAATQQGTRGTDYTAGLQEIRTLVSACPAASSGKR